MLCFYFMISFLCFPCGIYSQQSDISRLNKLEKIVESFLLTQRKQNVYIRGLENTVEKFLNLTKIQEKKIQNLEMDMKNQKEAMKMFSWKCDLMCSAKSNGQGFTEENKNGNKKHLRDMDFLVETKLVRKRRELPVDQMMSKVAFYAYMTSHLEHPGREQTLIFRSTVTNLGNHYNNHSGIFTVPDQGVYVFTWTIVVSTTGYIYTQVLVNSDAVGSMYTSAYDVSNVRTTTGIIVVQVNRGDIVFVRTNSKGSLGGIIVSDSDLYRSTFSGWKVY